MQIFIRGAAKLLALDVQNDETVQDLYEHVAGEADCDVNSLLLSLHGRPLDHQQTVAAFDLVPGIVLDAYMKVLGGKVHGSLNKVGYVKNNTPKVPPQEKPKKKTGRARRREQYSQRFKSQVASPSGPRRGPNSNYQLPA